MAGEIIVRVPGYWENHQAALKSIAVHNPDLRAPKYFPLGNLLMEMSTQTTFSIEFFPFQHQTVSAFEIMAKRLGEEDFKAIRHHLSSLRISTPVKGLETAREMLHLVDFLLTCGGLGVWVETSGLVHSREQWAHYCKETNDLANYDAFVAVYEGERCHYTCGMQNLDLADVSCTADQTIDAACSILHAFNQTRIIDKVDYKNGDLFRTSNGEPSFEIWHQTEHLPSDSLRFNHHGRWQLMINDLEDEEHAAFVEPPASGESMARYLELCLGQVHASMSYFIDHFQSRLDYGLYMFRALLTHGNQQWDLWLNLMAVDDNFLIGELLEVPDEVQVKNRQFRVGKDEIIDWAITRHHALIGGFSIRFERESLSEEEKQRYDETNGIISYIPIDGRWCKLVNE